MLSITGIVYGSGTVTMFGFLKSMQSLTLPSGFGTGMISDNHGETSGQSCKE